MPRKCAHIIVWCLVFDFTRCNPNKISIGISYIGAFVVFLIIIPKLLSSILNLGRSTMALTKIDSITHTMLIWKGLVNLVIGDSIYTLYNISILSFSVFVQLWLCQKFLVYSFDMYTCIPPLGCFSAIATLHIIAPVPLKGSIKT